ncbi:MAG: hypothetical protein JJ971_02070 [Balneolaceae bacterium]|nr:hypothetical protein [Balneolaceae bacterium]MBO6545158.1 hypothetical protein [Balneolaceae bacterium]MBO6646554.1 hypothetical protein [Balneolaceae bacterium]
MEYRVSFASRFTGSLILSLVLLLIGCKSSENIQGESANEVPQQLETVSNTNTGATGNQPRSESVTVNYKNGSSNIQIQLDPSQDEFYLDLSGMTPAEKDSIMVKDSTLIKNRAIDIQSLLSSYRKAQDLFYLGEYRQALEEVDKTIEIQETADAYALKGTIFFMLENITAAQANWTRAVQMDPNIPVPSIPELETLIEEIRGQEN